MGAFVISCNLYNSNSFDQEKVVIDSYSVETAYDQRDSLIKYITKYDLAKKELDYVLMANTCLDIAEIFRDAENVAKAIDYSKLAYKWSILSGDDKLIIQAESKLGKNFLGYWNSGQEGVTDEKEVLIDSAKYYLSSSIRRSEILLESSVNTDNHYINEIVALNYSNLSAISFAQKNMKEAEEYAYNSYKFFTKNKDTLNIAIAFNNLGNVNFNKNEFQTATDFYRKGISLIESLQRGTTKFRNEKVNLLINLAWSLRKLEGVKENSYDILYQAFEIDTSLQEEGITEMLAELEKKHNVEKVRKEEADRANDFKIFSGLLLFLTIILAGTIFTLYRGSQLKQKNLELQLDKEQLLKSAELERLEKLSQTKVLNATMDGRESERKLIAEILHDSVSSLLSSANLHLQASRSVYNQETPEEIEKSQRIIEEASEKIRNLSHELISSVLLKFGLSYSIFDLCEKYSNSQLEIVHDINRVRRYDQSFEIKVNNIIEELVNNILKHSKATEAIISLEEREGQLFLEITDNGEGFDYHGEPNTSGLGLNQIKARVLMMKGKINIDSISAQGTTINIVVPVVKREVRKSELA